MKLLTWSRGLDRLNIFYLMDTPHEEEEKPLKNDIKCDYSVNRGRRVLKTPLWHI